MLFITLLTLAPRSFPKIYRLLTTSMPSVWSQDSKALQPYRAMRLVLRTASFDVASGGSTEAVTITEV